MLLVCQPPILLSQVFSHLPSLWSHFCLLLAISHSGCPVFHFLSAGHPLPPQEASPSLELRQKERVEKSFTLFELSLPFPGLLTPISSSSLLLAGSLGIFPNILTSILSCHLEAGAALLQGSDRSSFSFSSEGFCCYLFHLFNPLCRLYSFCLRVARQNWLHQAS